MGFFNKNRHEERAEAYSEGLEAGQKFAEDRIRKLERQLEKAQNDAGKYASRLEDAADEIEALEEAAERVREVRAAEIEVADRENVLEAEKKRLDAKTAKLKELEKQLDDKKEGRYKEGYADGVADGVRKVSEITAKDREDAMKIAMVAASAHTPIANLQEINDVHQITAGPANRKG